MTGTIAAAALGVLGIIAGLTAGQLAMARTAHPHARALTAVAIAAVAGVVVVALALMVLR